MGAHTCCHVIKAASKAEAVKKAEEYQHAERREYGQGAYTGHLGTAGIGVVHCRRTFETLPEAEEWIYENHYDKWALPMLAKVGTGDTWILAGWCAS